MEVTILESLVMRRPRIAWCLYDFANSSFTTVMVTAVYVHYFAKVVAEGGPESDLYWGLTISVSMAIVALTSPVLGALSDVSGRRKRFLLTYTMLCAIPTALLFFPREGHVAAALILFGLANVGFEGGYVFYNSWLPDLAKPSQVSRLSGKAWATGYLGGMIALILSLALFKAGHTAWIPPLIAVYFLVFALPALLWLPEKTVPQCAKHPVRESFMRLAETFREARQYKNILLFLAAFFFYNDAIVTIIVFAGRYATEALGFSTEEAIKLIIVINVAGIVGALSFGYLGDRIGPRRAILITLVVWICVCLGAMAVQSKGAFWLVANVAGLAIGSSQSVSRALMARLLPEGRSAQFFGLQTFCGRLSAVLGPAIFGAIATGAGHRMAVLSPLVFFIVGLLLLLKVDDSKSRTLNS